jgi:hypothetical protein
MEGVQEGGEKNLKGRRKERKKGREGRNEWGEGRHEWGVKKGGVRGGQNGGGCRGLALDWGGETEVPCHILETYTPKVFRLWRGRSGGRRRGGGGGGPGGKTRNF